MILDGRQFRSLIDALLPFSLFYILHPLGDTLWPALGKPLFIVNELGYVDERYFF
jgi:hypothetical protein